MEFDPESIAIGGVQLIAFTFGLVEFVKANTNLSGKGVTLLSFVLGALLFLGFNAEAFFPGSGRYVELAVQALTAGLAASGYYKFLAARLQKPYEGVG